MWSVQLRSLFLLVVIAVVECVSFNLLLVHLTKSDFAFCNGISVEMYVNLKQFSISLFS